MVDKHCSCRDGDVPIAIYNDPVFIIRQPKLIIPSDCSGNNNKNEQYEHLIF